MLKIRRTSDRKKRLAYFGDCPQDIRIQIGSEALNRWAGWLAMAESQNEFRTEDYSALLQGVLEDLNDKPLSQRASCLVGLAHYSLNQSKAYGCSCEARLMYILIASVIFAKLLLKPGDWSQLQNEFQQIASLNSLQDILFAALHCLMLKLPDGYQLQRAWHKGVKSSDVTHWRFMVGEALEDGQMHRRIAHGLNELQFFELAFLFYVEVSMIDVESETVELADGSFVRAIFCLSGVSEYYYQTPTFWQNVMLLLFESQASDSQLDSLLHKTLCGNPDDEPMLLCLKKLFDMSASHALNWLLLAFFLDYLSSQNQHNPKLNAFLATLGTKISGVNANANQDVHRRNAAPKTYRQWTVFAYTFFLTQWLHLNEKSDFLPRSSSQLDVRLLNILSRLSNTDYLSRIPKRVEVLLENDSLDLRENHFLTCFLRVGAFIQKPFSGHAFYDLLANISKLSPYRTRLLYEMIKYEEQNCKNIESFYMVLILLLELAYEDQGELNYAINGLNSVIELESFYRCQQQQASPLQACCDEKDALFNLDLIREHGRDTLFRYKYEMRKLLVESHRDRMKLSIPEALNAIRELRLFGHNDLNHVIHAFHLNPECPCAWYSLFLVLEKFNTSKLLDYEVYLPEFVRAQLQDKGLIQIKMFCLGKAYQANGFFKDYWWQVLRCLHNGAKLADGFTNNPDAMDLLGSEEPIAAIQGFIDGPSMALCSSLVLAFNADSNAQIVKEWFYKAIASGMRQEHVSPRLQVTIDVPKLFQNSRLLSPVIPTVAFVYSQATGTQRGTDLSQLNISTFTPLGKRKL